jgi:hypothetical protein
MDRTVKDEAAIFFSRTSTSSRLRAATLGPGGCCTMLLQGPQGQRKSRHQHHQRHQQQHSPPTNSPTPHHTNSNNTTRVRLSILSSLLLPSSHLRTTRAHTSCCSTLPLQCTQRQDKCHHEDHQRHLQWLQDPTQTAHKLPQPYTTPMAATQGQGCLSSPHSSLHPDAFVLPSRTLGAAAPCCCKARKARINATTTTTRGISSSNTTWPTHKIPNPTTYKQEQHRDKADNPLLTPPCNHPPSCCPQPH